MPIHLFTLHWKCEALLLSVSQILPFLLFPFSSSEDYLPTTSHSQAPLPLLLTIAAMTAKAVAHTPSAAVEPIHWLIRDTDDGVTRVTKHLRISSWTIRGLHKQLVDTYKAKRESISILWSLLQAVYTQDSRLMIALGIGQAIKQLFPVGRIYWETSLLIEVSFDWTSCAND